MVLPNKTGGSYLSASKSLSQFFHVILNLGEFKSLNKSFIIYPNRKLLFQGPKKTKHRHDEDKFRDDLILIIIINADKPMNKRNKMWILQEHGKQRKKEGDQLICTAATRVSFP